MRRKMSLPVLAALLLALVLPAQSLAASAVVRTYGSRSVREIALTFDDGWGTANCGKVLDILLATRTPATFLPTLTYVRAAPSFWKRVAALGFPIANHTATHPNLLRLSYAAQLREIASAEAGIEKITGTPMAKVLRPPSGAYNGTTLRAAAAAGYDVVLNWDTTFADTSRRPGGGLWPLSSYQRAASRGIAGSVILGHCGSPVDFAVLARVIAGYRARGFTFVTVPQLLHLPGARTVPFGLAGR
jgi:peptidoglycan/xylan/chitin deacetylase (PgdA/CDA1 family)